MARRLVLGLTAGLVLTCAAFEAAAGTVNRYSSLWVFGDSLSDPGNLYAATGDKIPESPPYFEGRRSNGPVWAEYLTADFDARGLAAANFAYALANALPNDDVAQGLPFQVPDLPDQIAEFALTSRDRLGTAPIASLWFGSNDIFQQMAVNPDPVAVATTAARAANAVAEGVTALAGFGIEDFLVFNLPALEKTPQFTLLRPEAAPLAKIGSDTFNATLADRIAELSATGLRVGTLDMHAAFDDLIAHPRKYGLTNATDPCLIPGVSICTPEQAKEWAFFDPVHPNAVVHSEIAGLVGTKIAPVTLPLPVLLLVGGIASLGFAARRRT